MRKLNPLVSLQFGDPGRLVSAVSREVEKNGAGDNYTMVYVRVDAL